MKRNSIKVSTLWLACFALLVLGMAVPSSRAYADTYNFYFDKKPRKGPQRNLGPTIQVEDEDQVPVTQQYDEETAPPPVIREPIDPPTNNSQSQTLGVPSGAETPIVINNINNVGTAGQNSTMSTSGPEAHEMQAPAAPPIPNTITQATVRPIRYEVSPWKFGISVMVLAEEYEGDSWWGDGYYDSYDDYQATAGGLVNLGYSFSKVVGLNLFLGLRSDAPGDKEHVIGGIDLEIMPFRVESYRGFDIIKFGFLAGASTIMPADENFGTIHAGSRFDLNFSEHFGLTAALRANLGYLMLQGGIVTRL